MGKPADLQLTQDESCRGAGGVLETGGMFAADVPPTSTSPGTPMRPAAPGPSWPAVSSTQAPCGSRQAL